MQTDSVVIGSSSASTQTSPWHVDGRYCDAAVMAAADLRSSRVPHSCAPLPAPSSFLLMHLYRTAHTQTSSGEGSASVACGCDIALHCTGTQTEEKWADAAAAAETIEGLQQELVGHMGGWGRGHEKCA